MLVWVISVEPLSELSTHRRLLLPPDQSEIQYENFRICLNFWSPEKVESKSLNCSFDVDVDFNADSDSLTEFLSLSPDSISRLWAGPSWILHTMATRPCRRPPPTSTPATLDPQKQRMMGKCPVTPFGCGLLCWQPLATLWWWLWFAPVPSDEMEAKVLSDNGKSCIAW